jgi:hypothetical protein
MNECVMQGVVYILAASDFLNHSNIQSCAPTTATPTQQQMHTLMPTTTASSVIMLRRTA